MHQKTIGGVTVTAISDGILTMTTDRVIGMDGPETARRLGIPGSPTLTIDVNSFLVDFGGRYGVVDAGTGNSLGPTLGKQPENLRAMGVPPEKIEYVFLTHMHPDHSNGLIDDDGKPVYPNAEIYTHEDEARFWLDVDLPASAPEMQRTSQRNNRRSLGAYPGRVRRVKDGEVMSGVSAWLHAGHTPGHTAWLIQSRGEGIFIWGDIVHLAKIQVAQPDAAMVFDFDPVGARAARVKAFDRAAADRLWVAGAHLDFPGFGQIRRKGAGYQYEAG